MTMHPRLRPVPRGAAQRGFSLIELMISIVIAMALIIAMGIVFSRFETTKRQVGASADLSLNTGYLTYDLDRQLRSAGSGFTNNATAVYGCELTASLNNTQILPATTAFPAPFASVPQTVRMMPILVHPGAGAGGSDVIQVMTGSGGVSENPTEIRLNSVATNTFRQTNTLGIRGNDILLISENGQPCMIQQVNSSFTGGTNLDVMLAGNYYASAIGTRSINSYSVANVAKTLVMGNVAVNPPRFQLIGINADEQLVAYDLLRFNNDSTNGPLPLAEGVVDMRVRYGVATGTGANVGVLSSWVKPDAAPYNVATMNADTTAAKTAIAQIVALKIAVVLRADRIEQDPVTAATLTMFPSLATSLQAQYTVSGDNQKRKHRVVEFTVPLRNPLVASGRPMPP